jgi:virulence-associated protein VagC
LPKEFRVQGEEVRIRRQGRAIVLKPIANDWDWLDSVVRDAAASGCSMRISIPAVEAFSRVRYWER